jgi:MoeA N-terminal region (domain I and II)
MQRTAADGPRLGPQAAYSRWIGACKDAGWLGVPAAEQVPVREGLGRVTAAPVRARWPAPRATCAAMGGIAIKASSAACPADAGSRSRLAVSSFTWVDTGDPVPAGLDTVVERERVQLSAGRRSHPGRPSGGQGHRGPAGPPCLARLRQAGPDTRRSACPDRPRDRDPRLPAGGRGDLRAVRRPPAGRAAGHAGPGSCVAAGTACLRLDLLARHRGLGPGVPVPGRDTGRAGRPCRAGRPACQLRRRSHAGQARRRIHQPTHARRCGGRFPSGRDSSRAARTLTSCRYRARPP